MIATKISHLPLVLGLALGLGGTAAIVGLNRTPTPTEAPATAVQAVPSPSEITEAPPPPAKDRMQINRAVRRGLDWLKQAQDRQTGGWITDVGYKYNSSYNATNRQVPHVGVTSLALMAFLSGGHLPGRGRYGSVVERGTDFILSAVNREDGFISKHGTRMYSHAFATLFLAEIFGMTHRSDVKKLLQQAVDMTVDSQNEHGSWRYWPYSPDSDMSITVCQIMALRAARNVGLRVPKSVIDRAYDYVVRSAYKNPRSPFYGGFKYQEEQNSRTSFSVTSAGIATLNHSGVYEHTLINAGIRFLRRKMPGFNRQWSGHYFYWYGHYYAAQVFFMAQDNPKHRRLWEDFYWRTMSNELLRNQGRSGSWSNRTGPGEPFGTAVACIILQIKNEYLPIFHR